MSIYECKLVNWFCKFCCIGVLIYVFSKISNVPLTLLVACMQAGRGGELTHDETTIIAGALELGDKTASDAMTPISEIFSIDINAKLHRLCVHEISIRNFISLLPVSEFKC